MKKVFLRLATVIFAAVAIVVLAQQPDKTQMATVQTNEGDRAKMPLMVSLDDLKWNALPERPGMQFAVLSGNPSSGPYTQMRKVPAGTDNPLHSHSSEIKNVMIKGIWYTGTDAASAKDFGPGSIIVMPGNWVHVSGCRPGAECVFYQEGKGKFDFKPKDAKASQMTPE